MLADFGSFSGSWTGSMLVILPPLTVTLSWTLPYWLDSTGLVTVFADELVDADEDDEDDEPEDEPDDPDELDVVPEDEDVVDAAGEAVWAVGVVVAAGACAWKPSVAATPATVADRTMGARFMESTIPPGREPAPGG